MKKHINVSISEEIWIKIQEKTFILKEQLQKRRYTIIDYVYDLILKDLKEEKKGE